MSSASPPHAGRGAGLPLVRTLNRAEEAIISLLLVGMTLLVFFEVVLRFGFDTGLLWAQELTLHMAAWFVLFGASYGVKVGAHIAVDAVVRLLSPRARRLVGLIAVLLCLLYCGLFLYGSWVYLLKMHAIGIEMEDLPIPRWIAQGILLIGFGLLTIRFLQLFWAIGTGRVEGFHTSDEAEESLHIAAEIKSRGADQGVDTRL